MKPTIGRVVLYTSRYLELGKVELTVCPALVTRVERVEGFEIGMECPLCRGQGSLMGAAPDRNDPRCNDCDGTGRVIEEWMYALSLRVFYEDGDFIARKIRYMNMPPGTPPAEKRWCWPPRETFEVSKMA